ncbi:MAG: hypothetical protein ACKVVP_18385 [Chloroflexota bacterium]
MTLVNAGLKVRIALATIVADWNLEPLGEDWDVRRNVGNGPKHEVRMRVVVRRHVA